MNPQEIGLEKSKIPDPNYQNADKT